MDFEENMQRTFKKRILATASTETKKQPDPAIRLLGGMTSGVIEALLLTPLDVTKTRLQLDTRGQYKGMIDCGRQLVTAEGPAALYKGLAPWTWHVVLKNGTRYGINAVFRQLLLAPAAGGGRGKLDAGREFLAGFMAGAAEATLIVTPFEVIKTRLQATDKLAPGGPKYTGMVQTARAVVRAEGALALWNGLTPTVVRQSVNQACSFATNALLREHVWRVKEGDKMEVWKSAVSGVLGAIPGPVLNCPADVVKTRLMNQSTPKGAVPYYRGPVHALTTIAREEGVAALYKGLFPRLARLCPSYAIQWVVVDQFTQVFSDVKIFNKVPSTV